MHSKSAASAVSVSDTSSNDVHTTLILVYRRESEALRHEEILASSLSELVVSIAEVILKSLFWPFRERHFLGRGARTGPRAGFGALQRPFSHHGSLLPVDGHRQL